MFLHGREIRTQTCVCREEVMGNTVTIHNLGERLQKNPNLLILDLGLFSRQHCEKTNLCCLSHMVWRVHVQLCPTLCVPMDYIAHQALLSTEFSNQETLE